MALEQIGLQAILQDENFQAGLKRYNQGVSQMEKSTDNAANVITRLGSVMSGALVIGIGAATAAFGALVGVAQHGLSELQQWGEGIDKLGDQFGLTGEKASGFAFLASKVGAPVDELSMSLNTLTNGLQGVQDRIKSGSKTISPFEKALSQLGISAIKSNGKLKTFDELLPELMDGFNKLPPGIKASSIAMDIFGTRGGGKMLDFLRQGSKGLVDATAKAKLFGLELSEDVSNAVEEFGFATNELGLELKGLWVQIGVQVLPIFRRLVNYISNNILPVLNRWVKDSLPKLVNAFNTFVQFVQTNVFPIITRLGSAIGGLVTAFQNKGLAGAIDEFGKLLASAFKGFDLSKFLGDVGGQVAIVIRNAWTKISPELAKWGNQFWNWLTGKGGALEQAGTQLSKVIAAIKTWATTNAPNWASILENWKTDFWNWLTDPNAGAIIKFGQAIKDFSEQMKAKVASGEVRGQIEQVGQELSTAILDALGAGITDSAAQTPLLLKFAESLGETFTNSAIMLDIIGTSFARGFYIGIYKKAGMTDDQARALATRFLPYSLQTQIYLAGQRTGQSGGDGVSSGLNSKSGAITDTARVILGTAYNNNTLNARNYGYGLGQQFGAGLEAALNAEVARVLAIVNYILTLMRSVQNFNPSISVPASSPINSNVSQPVSSNTTSNSRTINVTVPISGTFNGTSQAGVEAIAQRIADRTVAAVLGAT